jgi:serine protease Do
MSFLPAARLLLPLALIASLAACEKPDQKQSAADAPKPAAMAPVTMSTGPVPTLAPMLQKVSPAVVNISVQQTVTAQINPLFQDPLFRRFFNIPDEAPSQHVQAVGSGVIYDAAMGYIVTNNHVVEKADRIQVTLSDGRELTAKLVGTDPQTDIAVLKIEPDKLTALEPGDSDGLKVGDYVVAIGDPFGVGQTATFGIVSAKGRAGLGIEGYEDFIQTDASINPGNSGGALIDLTGHLIGINTAILSRSGGNVGIGFAIPISMAKNVIAQLIAHGKVSRGQLGVAIQDLTPPIAEAMGLPTDRGAAGGAIVSRVIPDSAAAKAGIKSGDIITQLDGKDLRNATQLRNAIGAMEPGTGVKLTLLRGGKTESIETQLQAPAAAQTVSAPADTPVEGLTLDPIPQNHPLFGRIEGVLVTKVAPGSAAENAGVEAGDIILAANQQPLKTPEDLLKIVDASKGKPLLLQIRRGDDGLFVVIQ